ncbi:MAG: GDSL-type esterase/lipase family protein [Bacteroidaceae bacterium]
MKQVLIAFLCCCLPSMVDGQTSRTVTTTADNEVRGTAGIMNVSLSADRKIKVACIGNSITFGHGIENREVNSYPAQLGKMLGTGFDVPNFGSSGAYLVTKAVDGWAYIQMGNYIPSKNFNPDVVIIKLGTNDTKPDEWKHIGDFDKDYTALIKSYRDLPSKPLVIMCYPMAVYYTNFGINDANQQLLRPKIKAVANREKCELIDFYSVTKGHPELAHDGVHPNANGAFVMAKLANQRFRDILCDKKETTTAAPVTVLASPKDGYEFVEWTDGTNVYTKNPLVYRGDKDINLVAKFRRIGETYCTPWGTTENSRYVKKLWAEVNGQKVDILGTDSTAITKHPGKVVCDLLDAAIVVSPGQSFKLKGISNNPDATATIDPIRRAVVFPFADWDRNMEFGGSETNEALPMIGRVSNDTKDLDAMAVVSLDQTIQVPADAKYGETKLRLCYTDGFSTIDGPINEELTHTACSPVTKGLVIDVTLQIVPQEGRFSFSYESGEKGSVNCDHEIGNYLAGKAIRLKAIPESNHVEFVSWTDGNDNVVSTRQEFIYYLSQDITLKANFKDREYPRLTHWYANASQANRFLNKVTAKPNVGGEVTTVLNLGTNPTKIPVNKDLKGGTAMMSVLNPKIRIPKGTTSFVLTCYSTHNVVEGFNNELGWTNQAVLVDWNQNYSFEEANEMYAPTSFGGANTINHSFGNAAGYSRTLTIPSKQAKGTYRMYIVYGEPSPAPSTWPIEMVRAGDVRMGNVYEMDIEIYDKTTDIKLPSEEGAKLNGSKSNYTLSDLKAGSQVTIYDADGKMLINTKVHSSTYSFGISTKGSYLIRIITPDNKLQTLRF